MKEGKIALSEDANKLIDRCKKIKDQAKNYPNSNEVGMNEILKGDKDIYNWL